MSAFIIHPSSFCIRRTFACLIGLISAVEKEAGKLGNGVYEQRSYQQ